MSSRLKKRLMVANATSRALGAACASARSFSPAGLRRASRDELARHRADIEADADKMLTRMRGDGLRFLRGALRCDTCDGSIPNAMQIKRRYCSGRCRQRAYRQAHAPPAHEALQAG
jgi:hypothetical protein